MGGGVKMRQLSISYTDLKAKATALSALYHYIDFTTNYGVFVYDPNNDVLFDALPTGADETDFETNIKPTATAYVGYNALFQVLEGQLATAPERVIKGFKRHKTKYWRRSFNYTAPAGVNTNFDVPLTQDIWLSGGAYKVDGNAVWGDRLEFIIVDVDGIISPPGTVLSRYVDDEYLWQGATEREITTDGAAKIIAGLYLRVRYYSIGATPVKFIVRHFMRRM